MNCFYHPSSTAVGTCKSCGKGLCLTCAIDLGKGLACRNRCEDEVRALINLIDSNVSRVKFSGELIDSAKRNRYVGAAFYIVFGLLFLGFVAYQYSQRPMQQPDYLLIGMGILFTLFGLFTLRNAIRIASRSK